MCCVIGWNKAYCLYPWALGEHDTSVLTCSLSDTQQNELERWLAFVGGSYEASMGRRYVGAVSKKPWVIWLESAVDLKKMTNKWSDK